MRTIIISAEMTGTDIERDELLQLSIIADDEELLYDSYFTPEALTSWEEGEAVNHISPEYIQKHDYPHISDEMEEIKRILLGADEIIGWDLALVKSFLKAKGAFFRPETESHDIRRAYPPPAPLGQMYADGYYWTSLEECAEYYEYKWTTNQTLRHNSLDRCFAILHCYKGACENLF